MNQKSWYCLSSSVGRERAAEARLQSKSIETCLPLCLKIRETPYIRSETTAALFPGYLFAYTSLNGYQNAMLGLGVGLMRFVRAASIPQVVDEGVIWEIRSRMNEHGLVETDDQRLAREVLTPGESVRVVEGASSGYEGLFVRDEKTRIIVLMNFFGSQREVPMPRSYVRPIDYASV
jgi:transcription antitermination factor NusG